MLVLDLTFYLHLFKQALFLSLLIEVLIFFVLSHDQVPVLAFKAFSLFQFSLSFFSFSFFFYKCSSSLPHYPILAPMSTDSSIVN